MNAIVTGGTKGIGKAIAIKLVKQGFNVAICGRNLQDLKKAEKDIQAENPEVKVYAYQVDLSKKEQTIVFGRKVQDVFNNNIEILVNNAGLFIPGDIHRESDGLLENLMSTNLYSAYHLTRTVLPGMINLRKGHIFNICSVASLQAYPNGGSYSITKFALLGFSKNLREELKQHNIKVTAISPGATMSGSWDGMNIDPNRIMQAEDIAEVLWTAYRMAPQTLIEDIVLRPIQGDL
jgi:short-subunit dehydrogenase